MRVLVLGGSGWLGGAVARCAIAHGDDVVCVSRRGGAAPGAVAVVADRDHDDALLSLAGDPWDAVFDVSSQPGHVRAAARQFAKVAVSYVYVSSVSVYDDHSVPGADETGTVVEPLADDALTSMELYPQAKSACEAAVGDAFPGRCLIVRPGLIGGPGDPTGRTTYWPWRMAHPVEAADGTAGRTGRRVLVPDCLGDPVQVIDVRDLAAWLVRGAREGLRGTLDAVGDRRDLAEHLTDAAACTSESGGDPARWELVPPAWLRERGVQPWAGERSLPLWIGDPSMLGLAARDGSAARRSGLVVRPLEQTLRDGVMALAGQRPRGAGLSDDDERALLAERRNLG